jgi:DNA-binding IclR family transcriptional regulator
MSLLKAFGPTQHELGVSELGRLTGLHKTTVYRLLVTLAEEGFIQHNPANDKYRLGAALIRLGRMVLDNIDIGRQALPRMRALADETGEAVMLEVWDGGRTLVVASVDGRHFAHIIARAGSHLPAHGSSGGKAMLAFLPSSEVKKVVDLGLKQYTANTLTDAPRLQEELARIRATQISVDRQEIDIGVCSIGAPIFDHSGQVAAALTVTGPAQRIPTDPGSALAQTVAKTARVISRDLGYESEG